MAILSNYPETVETFIEDTIWPQWRDQIFINGKNVYLSIVAFAYQRERWAIVRLLIEKGVDMRSTDHCVISLEDMIHLAALTRDTKVLQNWISWRWDLPTALRYTAELYMHLTFWTRDFSCYSFLRSRGS
jgi:hypothetical protein